MSAAPETLSASRRLVALSAVALAAFGIAFGARESGALAPLELVEMITLPERLGAAHTPRAHSGSAGHHRRFAGATLTQ